MAELLDYGKIFMLNLLDNKGINMYNAPVQCPSAAKECIQWKA